MIFILQCGKIINRLPYETLVARQFRFRLQLQNPKWPNHNRHLEIEGVQLPLKLHLRPERLRATILMPFCLQQLSALSIFIWIGISSLNECKKTPIWLLGFVFLLKKKWVRFKWEKMIANREEIKKENEDSGE